MTNNDAWEDVPEEFYRSKRNTWPFIRIVRQGERSQ